MYTKENRLYIIGKNAKNIELNFSMNKLFIKYLQIKFNLIQLMCKLRLEEENKC